MDLDDMEQASGDPGLTCPTVAEATSQLPAALSTGTLFTGYGVDGNFSVSSAGTATYSVPLTLPPGRGGMVPELTVAYDSGNGGEGPFGVGFSLRGLSTISRCGSDYAHDDRSRGVEIDLHDRYCLDGARLELVADNGDTREYRTLPDSHQKVTATVGAGGEVTSWEVRRSSGRIATYGDSSDSRRMATGGHVLAWGIRREADRWGNGILYTYDNFLAAAGSTEVFSIQRIDYTDHPTLVPDKTVEFVYKDWTPSSPAYLHEMPISRTRRVHKIRVQFKEPPGMQARTVRVYRFDYEASPTNQRARLIQLRECATDAEASCKQPTRFAWQAAAAAGRFDAPQTVIAAAEGSSDPGEVETLTADWTGDGLGDLITLTYPFASIGSNIGSIFVSENRGGTFTASSEIFHGEHARCQPFDANLDGRTGLLCKHEDPNLYLPPERPWMLTIWEPAADRSWNNYMSPIDVLRRPHGIFELLENFRVADIDGDGTGDVVTCYKTQQGIVEYKWEVWFNGPGGVLNLPQAIPGLSKNECNNEHYTQSRYGGRPPSDTKYVDVNADGKVDLVVAPREHYEASCPSGGCTYRRISWEWDPATGQHDFMTHDTGLPVQPWGGHTLFVDFNGDGNPDAVQSRLDEPVAYLNTDGSFTPVGGIGAIATTEGRMSELLGEARLIDANHDGLGDLLVPFVRPGGDLPHWHLLEADPASPGRFVFTDLGISFIFESRWSDELAEFVYAGSMTGLVVLDADGDGTEDIVGHDLLNPEEFITRPDWDYRLYRGVRPPDRVVAIHTGRNPLDRGDPGYRPDVKWTYGNLVDKVVLDRVALGTQEEDTASYAAASSLIEDPDGCSGYPRRCVVGTKQVVRTYTVNDGANGGRTMTLAYRNGRYDASARTWLGFGARILRDNDTGATAIDFTDNVTYSWDYGEAPFAGMLTKSWRWTPGLGREGSQNAGDRVRITYITNQYFMGHQTDSPTFHRYTGETTEEHFETVMPAAGKPWFAFIAAEQDNITDRLAITTNENSDIDEYGRARTTVTEVMDSKLRDRTTRTRTWINDPKAWLMGLLDREQACSEANDATRCRVTDNDYNDQGAVTHVFTGDELDLTTHVNTTYRYDDYGNVIHETARDELGHVRESCTTPDQTGTFPIASRDGLGATTYVRFDGPTGVPLGSRDPNNLIWRRQIDGFGQPTQEELADGTTVTLLRTRTWDGTSWRRKVKTTRSAHGENTVELDMHDRVVRTWTKDASVRACEGTVCMDSPVYLDRKEYDRFGQVSRVFRRHLTAVPESSVPSEDYSYDALGRLIEKRTFWGATTRYAYRDLKSTRTEPTVPASTTVLETDALGRANRVWDAYNTMNEYFYGPFGGLDRIEHAGEATTWVNDSYNRWTKKKDPNYGTVQRTYDGFGNIETQDDDAGRHTSFTYDKLGRLRTRTDEHGVTTWTYDPNNCVGCIDVVTSPDGLVVKDYDYDAKTRLKSLTLTVDGRPFATSYEYDTWSRLLRQTLPGSAGVSATIVEYQYDAAGGLLAVKDGSTGFSMWQLRELNGVGAMRLHDFANGVQTSVDYALDRGVISDIKTKRGSVAYQDLHYEYDNVLNVTRRQDKVTPRDEHFGYDKLNRLTCVSGSASLTPCDTEVQYHNNGNIKWRTGHGFYGYDDPAHPHAVVSLGGTQKYKYDAVGNQTSRPGASLKYNAFDLPSSFTKESDGVVTTYDYDGDQQRVRRSTPKLEVITFGDFYELERNLTTGVETHRYLIDAGDARIVVTKVAGEGPKTEYLHPDALGTTDVVTNAAGGVNERRRYDVFGRRLDSGSRSLTRGFTGHEEDAFENLVNMKGRIYDPVIGRFLHPDPVNSDMLSTQRFNGYSYVLNNPLRYVDPTGFDEQSLMDSIGSFPPSDEVWLRVWIVETAQAENEKKKAAKPTPEGDESKSTSSQGASAEPVAWDAQGPGTPEWLDPERAGGGASGCPFCGYGSGVETAEELQEHQTAAAEKAGSIIRAYSLVLTPVAVAVNAHDAYENAKNGDVGGAVMSMGLAAVPFARVPAGALFASGKKASNVAAATGGFKAPRGEGKAVRALSPADLGLAENAIVEGTFAVNGEKATAYVRYLGKPAEGLGSGLLGARKALVAAAKGEGASVLRIETSRVIEETGRLAPILEKAGFGVRPNGTMFWEGTLK
ncbi:RHS repeat-associated core domain-containing protein [Sorangium sp. So ce1128]